MSARAVGERRTETLRRPVRRTVDFGRGLAPGGGARGVGVYVLGMHRSGTSTLTRMLNLVGVPLGRGDDGFSPDRFNPRGYWESRRLTNFQDSLLARLGGSWAAPPPIEDGWERSVRLAEMAGRGRRIFRAVYGDAPLWAWKDPRTAITLPFWLRALRAKPVVVVIHRHPLEVASSLSARSGMPRTEALALWERYNRAILRNAASLPAYVTSYARIVADAPKEAAGLASFLQGVGVELPAEAQSAGVDSFVESSLRHSAYDDSDSSSEVELTTGQRALRDALVSLEGAHTPLPATTLPPEAPSVEAVFERRRALPDHGRRGRVDA